MREKNTAAENVCGDKEPVRIQMQLRRYAETDSLGVITTDEIRLICPVCGRELIKNEKSYSCKKRHSFDIARQGYVNLLPVQNKHSLSPGDTKAMLSARRNFLDKEYYLPLCSDIADMIKKYSPSQRPVIIDSGSGEGYYTVQLKERCNAVCMGVDIAKEASKMSCSRDKEILWAVATASHIPVEDNSADVVTAVFSLFMNDEYARVLKEGGIVVEVTAGSKHLTELKQIIYDEVFEQNKKPSSFGEQYSLITQEDRVFGIDIGRQDLEALLMMTPHSHRISREQSERIEKIDNIRITVNYIVRVLKKKEKGS